MNAPLEKPKGPVWQDYHLHTQFSCDGQASMEAMCRAAVSAGLREIGFTEHYDLIPDDPCFDYFKPQVWWRALEACRTMFAGQLTIRAGIEIGEPHRFTSQVERIQREYEWDYCLGSLHWVSDQLIFDPEYYQQPAQEAYRRYFQELLTLVESGMCDVLAHADIVKRYGFDNYGPFLPQDYEGDIRAVLRACAQTNMALEINTSTLRRPVAQTSPGKQIVGWYYEEGGRHVTIGSDAHLPEEVGSGLDQIVDWLPKAGFERLTVFESRRPRLIPLLGEGN